MMATTENEQPGSHQHDWLMLRKRDGSLHVMPNASCAVCGLTPEAVANEAAIKTLLAERDRLRDRLRDDNVALRDMLARLAARFEGVLQAEYSHAIDDVLDDALELLAQKEAE